MYLLRFLQDDDNNNHLLSPYLQNTPYKDVCISAREMSHLQVNDVPVYLRYHIVYIILVD